MRRFCVSYCVAALAVSCILLALGAAPAGAEVLAPKALLGQKLYLDRNLSSPAGLSCSDCHLPGSAFVDPDKNLPVSAGIIDGRFGGRNAPTAAYAAFSPRFHYDEAEALYVGGQFWDGRAATLADQAKGPFLNPVEMNNTMDGVVAAVRAGDYADLFRSVYGQDALDAGNEEKAYDQIAEAIEAFESSGLLSTFNSKFDKVMAGKAWFTPEESWGFELFNGKANCAACHPSTSPDGGETPALFTDFTYDNLGIGRNPWVCRLTGDWYSIDRGLGAIVNDPEQNGKFKVPSLRNIARTAPYGHNGFFPNLREIVDFYNARDVTTGRWPNAEVPETVNHDELGNLGLTKNETLALIAFLRTLTDER